MIFATLSLVGCGKKEEASSSQLDIYILDAGYGTEWLNKVSEEFQAQDWVKEKYPNLSIKIDTNAESSYAEGKITAGANANPYDLLFGINLQTVYNKRDSNRNTLLLDISDVYDSEVPEEDVLVKEKMLESAILANAYTDISGETAYYAIPWAGGFNGILYNADKLKNYGEVPVTTAQLLTVMEKVTKAEGYSIMQSCENSGACYWEHLYPIWWAQYEGYDNYMSFWEGKVDGKYSVDIFKQQGRLESLKVLENVLGSGNKNLFGGANATAFIDAQTNFLMGQGVFMANGDWFDREMSEIKEGLKSKGYDYDIRMMKTPVISSIINKTTTIPDDATLAAVVKAVDNGEMSYAGVSAEDFQTVASARRILYSVGNLHNAVIPSYSGSIDVAKDFLRFLATDKANEIYAEETCGSGMFYKYDMQEVSPELYESLSGTAKMRTDFYNDKNFPAMVLPNAQNFNLSIYGGVNSLNATAANQFEILFNEKNPKTAQEIFDADIKFWSDSAWSMVLSNIGVSED